MLRTLLGCCVVSSGVLVGAATAQLELRMDDEMVVSIVNSDVLPIEFTGYEIVSNSRLLDSSEWTSLRSRRIEADAAGQDQVTEFIRQYGVGAYSFREWNQPNSRALGEIGTSTTARLEPGDTIQLGKIFRDQIDAMEADPPRLRYSRFVEERFEFELVETCLGIDVCPPLPMRLPGDTNEDDHIDLGDFNAIKDNFGLVFDRPADRNEDGETNIFDHIESVNLILSGSGEVDLSDINLLFDEFGTEPTYRLGDTNSGLVVDLNDFNLLKESFGSTAVPEPSSLILGLAGALVIASLAARGPRTAR